MLNSRWLRTGFFHSKWLRKLTPSWIKIRAKGLISYADFRSEQCRREAVSHFGGEIPEQSTLESKFPVRFGIFSDSAYYYAFHVAACIDLQVAFTVIDLTASDWVRRVTQSGCDAFLASPSTLHSQHRHIFDERLHVLSEDMKRWVFPSFEELWLWESKRRMREWLVAHEIPHPKTEIFVNADQALDYLRTVGYPAVIKTNNSASANGIFVIRNEPQAVKLVRNAFGRGILPRNTDHREAQHGYVIIQEFVPHNHEWRIVRIGDDYLCRKKYKKGDYASGSGEIEWAQPPESALDFVEWVTGRSGFRSMAVDFFEREATAGKDRFLVNELQALIGPIVNVKLRNAYTGKWFKSSSNWSLEPGFFYQNACANLRVAFAARELLKVKGESTFPCAKPMD
jgi:glutathione synthase/RimK-type ligase-like ATP-grasp enzyme